MLWIARTGSPWRDLPDHFGKWQTAAGRFYHWRRQGVFARTLTGLLAEADAHGTLNWLLHFVDGSVVRAHQDAAGARKQPSKADQKGIIHPPDQALGRSRGGLSTKLHLRTEGNGRPMVIIVTGGQAHENPILPALMETGQVHRPGPGRPRVRPDRVAGDKGYSYPSGASTGSSGSAGSRPAMRSARSTISRWCCSPRSWTGSDITNTP
jgi:Putative transposase of IS4/5 family (DUF4096)/Transposase DDE domain